MVHYYYLPKGKGKEAKVWLFFGLWLERNLVHRGVSKEIAFTRRVMTRDEALEDMVRTRMYCCSYDSWQALIDDDRKMGVPESFLQQLKEYQKRHPLRVQWRPDYVPPAAPDPPAEQGSLFRDIATEI